MKPLQVIVAFLLVIESIYPSTINAQAKKSTKAPTSTNSRLKKLKAVIVVGPVEEFLKEDVERAKVVAKYLRDKGVQVKEFYPPYDKWTNIVNASKDANIFMYSGHGTTCGENGKAGGLCLSNETFIYSTTISKELKLHKNALVLFNCVCYAAGSSDSDEKDIGVKEAITRVSDYARPFFKSGATGYYVSNYEGSMVPFLQEFFKKRSIKQVYTEKASEWTKIEITQTYKYNPNYEVSVASNDDKGFYYKIHLVNGVRKEEKFPAFKVYDVAYVGKPDFTVNDFFK